MLITNINEDQSLLTRLEHLVAESDELRVLVGFFYFWGVSALHGGLIKNKDFKLKILVGLEAEDHAGKIVEYAGAEGAHVTDEERRKDFLSGLRSVMRGKEIDTRQYYERVSLFIELVRSGQVEIRKTREPNHAKLYHFSLKRHFADTLGQKYCWIRDADEMAGEAPDADPAYTCYIRRFWKLYQDAESVGVAPTVKHMDAYLLYMGRAWDSPQSK